jgi:hypothetical protein
MKSDSIIHSKNALHSNAEKVMDAKDADYVQ